jgi:putative acetyltransferase
MINDLLIRPIKKEDNEIIASLIRGVLTEFGANRPGTVFTDKTTDNLHELFEDEKARYFIAEVNGEIVGGSGIYPTQGLPEGCTELVKLYVSSKVRGTGVGKVLMQKSIEAAKEEGYVEVYLETLPELHLAVGLYERVGFEYLTKPYGNTGHFACDLWMRKIIH